MLSKQALDALNKVAEIKKFVDFCNDGGPTTRELYQEHPSEKAELSGR